MESFWNNFDTVNTIRLIAQWIVAICAVVVLVFTMRGATLKNIIDKKKELVDSTARSALHSRIETANSDLQIAKSELSKAKSEVDKLKIYSNMISSCEIQLFIDEITPESKVTEKKTAAGVQFAVALFNEANERFRFVTDFQFSYQQITPNIKRAFLIFKPEEPSQIIGKQVAILNRFEALVYNFPDLVKYFKFDKRNNQNLISIIININGIELINEKNIPHLKGELYSGQLSINLKKKFANIDEKYQQKLVLHP